MSKILFCFCSILLFMSLPPYKVGAQSPSSSDMIALNIQVGNKAFSAKLFCNVSTQALMERMPMTLEMSDLHRNEKYNYLPYRLPTASQRVGSIKAGDLMLYGDNCLVLFYENFSTSYSYTKLGYVEDVSSLINAVGRGSIQVAFAISE